MRRGASRHDADGFIVEKIREQPRRDRVLMCRASQKRIAFVTPPQQLTAKLRKVVKALFGNILGGCQESASHKNRGNSVFQMSLRSQRQQIF